MGFWVGGFVGWLPKTVLPDISVQLLALDGVDVNPIQYQMINCQIYIRFWLTSHYIVSHQYDPVSCYLENVCFYETGKKVYVKTPSGLNLISGKKRLAVYVGETIQLLDLFGFFLSCSYIELLRKNPKHDNYLVKLGCVNG